MQKTLTIGSSKSLTARQIIAETDGRTVGEDYISRIDGEIVYWNYRAHDGQRWYVCKPSEADSISVEGPAWFGEGRSLIDLAYAPANPAAVALGSIRSQLKAAASRENGKRGGRPRKGGEG